jgi:hypothetical protein
VRPRQRTVLVIFQNFKKAGFLKIQISKILWSVQQNKEEK